MSRLLTSFFAAVLGASITATGWAQFVQAGADTFNSAGANTFGSSGVTGQPGTAFPRQQVPYSNYYGGGPAFNSPQPGAAFTTRFNTGFGTNAYNPAYGGVYVSATPWFAIPTVRQQLQLNAIQYQQLYDGYVDASTRYNDAVAAIPASMAIAERAGQLQALQEVFNSEFNTTLDATVTSPELRQNFNALSAQYQNLPATNAPAIQPTLSLTPEQHRRLSLMAFQWNQLAAKLRERVAANQEVAPEEVSKLNSEAEEQIATTLTPEQQSIWPQLVGQYYDLDAPKPQPKLPTPPAPTNTPATPTE